MNGSIVFFLVCLFFCGRPAIALEIVLEDKQLQKCVEEIVQTKHWETNAAVTEIECHGKGIRSLKGLEVFAHLQKLSLFNNDLTSVDITPFKNIRNLNIAKNNVEVFALNKCPTIEVLYLFSNKLTQLTLIELPKLSLVKANDNKIIEFRYQNLPSLAKLYLFSNKMTTMDIYNLPATHYIDVRQNPMPDKLYQDMDKRVGVTFLHDGNAKDWQ